MIRRLASIGLSTSAIFLAVVAVLLNSSSLFFMGTALVCTIAACRFQAWLSVRGLRFERIAPSSAAVGDEVTVEITVWSDRRIRRPLVTVWDLLPPRLYYESRTPSFPIAPSFDMGITTHYSFRPLKRGKYRWSGIRVAGTDALGLAMSDRNYSTDTAELTVLPKPIPVPVELSTSLGWGISEAESGQSRGAGIEPRGVREYAYGDSLRHVHWRSSARTGHLLVKEFEAGANSSVAFVVQKTEGTELGEGQETSLELMCGHVAFLSERFLHMGSRVGLPLEEGSRARSTSDLDRLTDIYEALAAISAENKETVSADVVEAAQNLVPGSTIFVLMAVADSSLPMVIRQLTGGVSVVPLVYDGPSFRDRRGKSVDYASDGGYLDSLQAAGAASVMMPGYVSVTK